MRALRKMFFWNVGLVMPLILSPSVLFSSLLPFLKQLPLRDRKQTGKVGFLVVSRKIYKVDFRSLPLYLHPTFSKVSKVTKGDL